MHSDIFQYGNLSVFPLRSENKYRRKRNKDLTKKNKKKKHFIKWQVRQCCKPKIYLPTGCKVKEEGGNAVFKIRLEISTFNKEELMLSAKSQPETFKSQEADLSSLFPLFCCL